MDEKQIDLEEAIGSSPYHSTDLVPGTDHPPLRETSVQSLYLDHLGREQPNPVPMQPPIGYKKSPSIADQMRAMIAQASYEAKMAGAETEEEANDFDVGEDMEPHSPWEHDFDINPELEAMLALQSRPPSPAPGTPPAAPVAAVPPSPPTDGKAGQ